MRFRYLKIALLAGAFVANAPVDSAMLPVAHLSPTDRDDVPVPRAISTQKMPGVDDEERSRAFETFLKRITLSVPLTQQDINTLTKMVNERMSAQVIFDELKVQNVDGNLLADASWIKWAYCVVKLYARNSYRTIVDTMGYNFGYMIMAKKLLDAAAIPDTQEMANKLIRVLRKRGYASSISSLKLFDKLKLYSKIDNFFESKQFIKWIDFLCQFGGKHYAEDPLDFELSVFRQYYRMEDLLKMLTSPKNAYHGKCKMYLKKLKKDWLAEKKLPSTIVSLLAHDKEQDHLFLDLNKKRLSVIFWVEYWEQFNIENPDYVETMMQTLTNAVGPDRANTMIDAALAMEDNDTRDFASDIRPDFVHRGW